MSGGLGNDTYGLDSLADTIVENADEGTDTVHSSVTYSLASLANLENLALTGANAIDATGNDGDNVLRRFAHRRDRPITARHAA